MWRDMWRDMRRRMLSVVLLALGAVAARAAAQSPVAARWPAVVGALEVPQCTSDRAQVVRVLFVRRSRSARDAWMPFESQPDVGRIKPPSEWTVAVDGRARARVRTTAVAVSMEASTEARTDTSMSASESRVPVLALEHAPASLRITRRRADFAGWCGAPVVRPLAVVSASRLSDPDRWAPYAPTRAEVASLGASFRRAAGAVEQCATASSTARPFPYASDQLEVVRGYRDASGRRLVALRLPRGLFRCDGPPGDGWLVHWFELGARSRFIGRGLTLVDAGDYDDDGASELLFWSSAYDRDGYALLTADLRRLVTVSWSHH